MRPCLLNSRGFSMVQGLIIASVLAGTGLVTTKLLTDQKLAQKGAETRDQIEELHKIVYTVLQNRLNCKNTISSNSILSSSVLPSSDLTLTKILSTDSTNPEIETYTDTNVKVYMNNNVIVKLITLKAPDASGIRNLEVTYERLRSDDLKKKTKRGFGAKDIKKIIPIRIQINPYTNLFDGCYAFNKSGDKTSVNGWSSSETGNDLTKEMCNEMNSGSGLKAFVWDDANSICKLSTQCPNNQLYAGIDNSGTVICRSILDWDFNEVLDQTTQDCPAGSTAKFEINETTKKVKITCSGGTYISCQHALTTLGTSSATVTLKIGSSPSFEVFCRKGVSGGNANIDQDFYYALIASIAYNDTRTWDAIPETTGNLSGARLSTTNIDLIWNSNNSNRILYTTASGDSLWGSATASNWYGAWFDGNFDSNCGLNQGFTIYTFPSSPSYWGQNVNDLSCLSGSSMDMGRHFMTLYPELGNTLFYISSMGIP